MIAPRGRKTARVIPRKVGYNATATYGSRVKHATPRRYRSSAMEAPNRTMPPAPKAAMKWKWLEKRMTGHPRYFRQKRI